MDLWRNSHFIKFITWLILGLMSINPALALQYQPFNQSADFLSQIPDYLPRAYHIHASQKDDVLAILKQQGYDVIPATYKDARHFLSGNRFAANAPLQLAANTEIEHPPEDNCNKTTQGEECPLDCLDDDHSNDKGCPPECLSNPCTDTDPVERAKDTGPAPNKKQSKPAPRRKTSVFIDQGFRLPNISGGGNGKDAAAVMLIVIGVVVIAALFIYAGKWLVDLFSNDEDYYSYWWDIGTQFISLDTEANQHGNFTGLKFGGGFIANRLAHFGLSLELGKMDLDLLYNRIGDTPKRINLDGTYWLIGPTVRWLLGYTDTEQTINNSYFFLELLGGGSDRSEVDQMAVARVGFNTGIGQHLRLGIHYGAFYLGLDEDQGFANDGDNYWNMYGVELGYQF